MAWGQGDIGGRNRRRTRRSRIVRAVEPAIAADEAARICSEPRGSAGLRAPVYHRPTTTASPLNGRPFDGHSKRGNDRGGGHVHQRSVFGVGPAGGDGRWLLRGIRVERARRHEFRVSARAGRRNGSRPEGASTESGVTGAPSNPPLQRTKAVGSRPTGDEPRPRGSSNSLAAAARPRQCYYRPSRTAFAAERQAVGRTSNGDEDRLHDEDRSRSVRAG